DGHAKRARAADRRGARDDRRPDRHRVHGPGRSHGLGAAGLQAARQAAEGTRADPQPRRRLPVVTARPGVPGLPEYPGSGAKIGALDDASVLRPDWVLMAFLGIAARAGIPGTARR